MVTGNPYYLAVEVRYRADEYRRQAQQHRLARQARGEPGVRVRLELAELKCRARALLVGLGLAVEPCASRPLQAARS